MIIIFVLEAGIEYIPPSKCLLPVLGKIAKVFPGVNPGCGVVGGNGN